MIRRAVAVLALAAVLGACSGGDDAKAPAATRPTAPAAPSAAASAAPSSAPSAGPSIAPPTVSAPATAVDPPAGPTSDAGTVDAAWCAIAVDLHGLTTAFRQLDAADRQAVEVSLVAILERLAAIAPLAPPQLADDLAVSTEAFTLLDAALAETDYDLAEADLTVLETRTDAIAAANDRIRAYNTAQCGIDVGVTGGAQP